MILLCNMCYIAVTTHLLRQTAFVYCISSCIVVVILPRDDVCSHTCEIIIDWFAISTNSLKKMMMMMMMIFNLC